MAAARWLREKQRPSEAAERLERLQATFTKSILGATTTSCFSTRAPSIGRDLPAGLEDNPSARDCDSGALPHAPARTSLLCDDALLLMAEAALQRHPHRKRR